MAELGDVVTPEQLGKIGNIGSSASPKLINNSTLNDLNEVLKTVDGILGKFGSSLKDVIKKKDEPQKQGDGMIEVAPGVKVPLQYVQTNKNEGQTAGNEQYNFKPTPAVQTKEPEITINSMTATKDLLQRFKNLANDRKDEIEKKCLNDLVSQLEFADTAGHLEPKVHEWIKQFVGVKR